MLIVGEEMQSRMEKYYHEKPKQVSRTEKHLSAYKELYGATLDTYDTLPVSNNVNVIDVNTLKEMATRSEYKRHSHKEQEDDFWSDATPKSFEEEKIYDINELIKKVKEEKDESMPTKEKLTNYSYLAKLENKNSKHSIEEEIKQELLKLDNEIENVKKDINPALDILSDLKGDDDTITMEPMQKEEQPIPTNVKLEKDFYSGALKFESNDFAEEDESRKSESTNAWFKITVIILTILAVVLAVIYTIKNI